jgi:hypothetical protein
MNNYFKNMPFSNHRSSYQSKPITSFNKIQSSIGTDIRLPIYVAILAKQKTNKLLNSPADWTPSFLVLETKPVRAHVLSQVAADMNGIPSG